MLAHFCFKNHIFLSLTHTHTHKLTSKLWESVCCLYSPSASSSLGNTQLETSCLSLSFTHTHTYVHSQKTFERQKTTKDNPNPPSRAHTHSHTHTSLSAPPADWQQAVSVAVLDCAQEENFDVCKDYSIKFYPTFKVGNKAVLCVLVLQSTLTACTQV